MLSAEVSETHAPDKRPCLLQYKVDTSYCYYSTNVLKIQIPHGCVQKNYSDVSFFFDRKMIIFIQSDWFQGWF